MELRRTRPGDIRIGFDDLEKEAVVEFAIEDHPSVLLGEEDLGHEVLALGQFDGPFEVLPTLLGLAAEGRRDDAVEDPEVGVGRTVAVVLVEGGDPQHDRLDPGLVRHRRPVGAVDLDPGRPRDTGGEEGRHMLCLRRRR